MPRKGDIVDRTGNKYGRLTVTSYSHIDSGGNSHWHCLCDCGNTKIVSLQNLKRNLGCGCGNSDRLKSLHASGNFHYNKTHGESPVSGRSKEYRAYHYIKTRCYNPKSINYKYYGARGISMCERWLYSFNNFLSDMGRSPSPDFSVERINNDGNYEPSNCKWASKKEQANNRRKNTYV